MMKLLYKAVLMLCMLLAFGATKTMAQDFMIYPGKGQSNEQMEKDKYDCYSWAKGQSKFDPMQEPKATTPPPPQSEANVAGRAVRGAAGGALLGLGIGAIAGDAGKGAAIGALSGGALGGMRSHRQAKQAEQEQQQWEQQQIAQYTQKRNSYNRAYVACLEGRGYTVK
jgi:hypothetical protein